MNDTTAEELAEAKARLARTETELATARAQVEDLSAELETTNRGIIALHSELDAARAGEARALADREIIAERDRIARDLHDQVIQRVFAAGLTLQSIAGISRQPQTVKRLRGVIGDLDATIRELRTAIFALHDQPQNAESLRAQLIDLANQAQHGLGFAPALGFTGPIDAAVPDHFAADVLAVVREALSNITRHAHATAVEILVQAGEELVLDIRDNGRGIGDTTRSSGLRNMRERAESHGGTLEIDSTEQAGTRLIWRVPLYSEDTPGVVVAAAHD